ncbi:hypothetical protein [Streptosporangium sp. NPDC048865]|uniref:hypothetical protein n=1 Tax=Streptosporangium sp. NPDC048865 TaxID=3155766 RepID=UPI003442F64A
MGKFEGMDPKLVRDLLSEVQRAAEQMRNVEGKVAQLMSGAGLSSQSAHRPVQVADACDVMVRDVSARVTLLEKRVAQNTTAPAAEPKAGDPKPETGSPAEGAKPETGSQNGAKPETPKTEDLKPAVGSDDKPRVGDQSAESTRRDDPEDAGPGSPKADETKPEAKPESKPETKPESKPEAGSKGDETSPRDDRKETPKPEASGADDRKPETGSKADETSPREGEPSKETSKENGKPTDTAPREVPRPDPTPDPPKAEESRPESPKPDPRPDPPRAEEPRPEPPRPDPPKAEEPRPEPPRPDPAPEPPRAEEPRPEPPAPDPVPEAPRGDSVPPPDAHTPDSPAPRSEDARPEAPAPDRVPEVPNAQGAPVPGTPNAEGAPVPQAPGQDSAPAPDAPRADDARPGTPRVEDLRPAVPGPGENPQGGGQPLDTAPREAPDAPRTPEVSRPDTGLVPGAPQGESTPAPEPPRAGDTRPEIVNADDTTPRGQDQTGTAPVNDSDAKGGTGSKGDETTPRGDSTGNAPDAKGDTGSKGDETTPRGDSTGNAPDAKGDAGSKGDERSPRDGGGTSGDTVHDTSRKDHPDDIDQSGDSRAKVVEVDGVKVLQIPLDAPTAAEVDELLKNIEDIPPLEMPTIDGASVTTGPPGQVEPHGPLDSARPAYPLLDTAGPATDQTVQPPGTGGDAAPQSTGTTSGEPAPQPAGTTSGEPAAPRPAVATQGESPSQATGDAAPRPAGTASGEPAIQTAGTTSGEAATRPAGGPVPSVGDAVSAEAPGAGDTPGPAAGTAPGGVAAQPGEGSAARWADDGSDVVTAEARPLDLDALRTLADNAREIEPLEMPGVSVPDGETWGEGAWAPMDVGPDGPAGDVEPGDPLRPIPPPGGGR